MAEEKEIKVKILDDIKINDLKKILEELFDLKFGAEKYDNDVYYDLKDNFYFNLNHGFRIRNNNEFAYKALFFILDKKPNPWFVLEKEYKLPVTKENLKSLFNASNIVFNTDLDIIDINKLKEIFKDLSFIPIMEINKIRFSAKNKNYEICIDFIEKLGLFLEIEVKDDNFLDIFRNKLPFNFEEIRHGYTYLYAKDILKIQVPNFKDNFLKNSDWNFLEGQKQLVLDIINNPN